MGEGWGVGASQPRRRRVSIKAFGFGEPGDILRRLLGGLLGVI